MKQEFLQTNTQLVRFIQSERTLRSCLQISAGHSKHANTRLGTRTRLYTVVIFGTRNSAEIGTRHTPNFVSYHLYLLACVLPLQNLLPTLPHYI